MPSDLRILLIGATGQLGTKLLPSLRCLGTVIASARPSALQTVSSRFYLADLTEPNQIRRLLRETRPQLIVNAAAYTAVDAAESDFSGARAINTTAPQILSEEGAALGAALIHYSTDYVFDGSGSAGWRENDAPAPLNVYGETKLAGEEAIRQSGIDHLILRTSWVYGAVGHNFAKTMLRLGSERRELFVVDDQFGAPTSARWLAELTVRLITSVRGHPHDSLPKLGGTIHVACDGETNWHGFAVTIFEIAQAVGFLASLPTIHAVNSGQYPTPARRPLNSRLNLDKFRFIAGTSVPSWQTELRRNLPAIFAQYSKESQLLAHT